MKTLYKIIIFLAYLFLFQLGLSAQNLKPIPTNDSLFLNLKDSGSINLLLNDYDPNGDPMKITKFGRWAISSTIKTVITDTAILTINRNGLVNLRAKKAGIFKFPYIVQDGKVGGGKTGYLVLVVKNTDALKWLEVSVPLPLVYKDSVGWCTIYMGANIYKGQVRAENGSYWMQGTSYQTYTIEGIKTVNNQFSIILTKFVYEFVTKL